MSKTPEITPEYVAELQRQMAELVTKNNHCEANLKVSEMLRAGLDRMLKNERHARFGAKSEKLNSDQKHLPFEDIEVVQGMLEAASEEAEKATRKAPSKPGPRKSTKGNLPEHLPRVETVTSPRAQRARAAAGTCSVLAKTKANTSTSSRPNSRSW